MLSVGDYSEGIYISMMANGWWLMIIMMGLMVVVAIIMCRSMTAVDII